MKEFKLIKPKAHTEITFKPDKEDSWFIYIITNERKSGKQTSKSMIIEKDFDDFLRIYIDKGWVIFDPNAPIPVKEKKEKPNQPKFIKLKKVNKQSS
jgi:hypothetical protein